MRQPGQDDLLAADPVGQRAEDQEERRADQQREPDQVYVGMKSSFR